MAVKSAFRWVVAVVASVGVVAVAGCGQGTRACTLIGAESQVSVDWDTAHFPAGARYRLCADQVCRDGRTQPDDPLGTFRLPMPDATGPQKVVLRFRVTDPVDDRPVYDRTARVTLRKVTPNGEGCGPTAWQAPVRADPERGLVDPR
ncbi:hypothetical protein ACWFR1_09485 [Streptomyces sp. NPDC055103]